MCLLSVLCILRMYLACETMVELRGLFHLFFSAFIRDQLILLLLICFFLHLLLHNVCFIFVECEPSSFAISVSVIHFFLLVLNISFFIFMSIVYSHLVFSILDFEDNHCYSC